MTRAEAEKKALTFLNTGKKDHDLKLYQDAFEFEYGWIFSYNHAAVFDPRLEELQNRLSQLKASKVKEQAVLLTQQDLLQVMTEEEVAVLTNSAGSVGNRPVFVDRNTGEITYVNSLYQEAFVAEICQQKTGIEKSWQLFLNYDFKGDKAKASALKTYFELTATEVFQWIKKAKNGEPILEYDLMEDMIVDRDRLEGLGFSIFVQEQIKT